MQRRTKRQSKIRQRLSRRRLYAETLEDRRLLATLSFTPVGKTLTGGTLFANAGEAITVQARADSGTEISINNHQLNLTSSTDGLTFSGYRPDDGTKADPADNEDANKSDFSNVTDGQIADGVVSALIAFGQADRPDVVTVPPPKLLGSFTVTVPAGAAAGAEFTLTASNIAGAFGTALRPQTGDAFPITDFGDLKIQVGTAPEGVDLELTPEAKDGITIVEGDSEEPDDATSTNKKTQVTLAPGGDFMVKAKIESAPRAVSGYSLNFADSTSGLVLNGYTPVDPLSVFPTGETGLDTSATPSDPIVAAIIKDGATTPIPPITDIGTFKVTVPTTPGTYTLTANSTSATALTTTSVTDGDGASQIPIDNFGDITIVVEAGPTAGVDLELVPIDESGVVVAEVVDPADPDKMITQVTVDPDKMFKVRAELESAPRAVSGYSLNFVDSNNQLVLNNYMLTGSKFDVFPTGETGLDTSATPSDPIVAAIIRDGATTPIPPLEILGFFDVKAPTAPGVYRLTANSASASALSTTSVTDGSGESQIPIDDFGDILVRVSEPQVVLPTVEVSVAPSSVAEDGTANLVYTFTRTGPTTEALTVNYTVGGTASANDFTGTSTSVVIPAGESSETVDVDPTADTVDEQNETVVLTISPSSTTYTIGTDNAATGTIVDAGVVVDKPTVSVAIGSPSAVLEDGAANLVYTFSRTGATTDALTVNYTVGGTASANDFTGTSTSVIIPAGESSMPVTVDPTADTVDEGNQNETVILSISANQAYDVSGTAGSATGEIIDDDGAAPLPTVGVAVSPSSVMEDGSANLVYTFTRTGDPSDSLTVNYTTGGNATAGTDFTGTSSNVTFEQGQSEALVTVDPTADTVDEPDETVVIGILDNAAYQVSASSRAATGVILDDDPTPGGGGGDQAGRLIFPDLVTRPHIQQGDGQATAIMFGARSDTVMSINQILGSTSFNDEVSVMDENLNRLPDLSPGGGRYSAALTAGNLYVVMMNGRTSKAIFSIQSSAGGNSITGVVPTNLLNRTDVNADGESTALDALMVINRIDQGTVAEGEDTGTRVGQYYDVNGDGRVTPLDALRVINELERNNGGAGENTSDSVRVVPLESNLDDETYDGLLDEIASSLAEGESPINGGDIGSDTSGSLVASVVGSGSGDDASDEALSDEDFLLGIESGNGMMF